MSFYVNTSLIRVKLGPFRCRYVFANEGVSLEENFAIDRVNFDKK